MSRFVRRLKESKNGFDGRGIRPHTFRHTLAFHFLEKGAAVTGLQPSSATPT